MFVLVFVSEECECWGLFCVRTEQLTVTTERKTNSNESLLICPVREVRHEFFNTNDVFLLLKSFKNRVLQNINFELNKYRINITKITAQLKDDEFLEVLALETAAIMTSCWCWVSRASWCFSTRYRFGPVSACWWGVEGGVGGSYSPVLCFLLGESSLSCPMSCVLFPSCLSCSLHPLQPDHGMGRESHRDPVRGDGTPRRSFHAQASSATEVSVREKRQGGLSVKTSLTVVVSPDDNLKP